MTSREPARSTGYAATNPILSRAHPDVGSLFTAVVAAIGDTGSPVAGLEARLLVGAVFDLEPGCVHRDIGRPAVDDERERLLGMVRRRLAGEPVYRVIGERPFYQHVFALSTDTLEPRPDTECLVEAGRAILEDAIAARGTARFADIGTGSGAIAISLLAALPVATCLATDISKAALATALDNARRIGVATRFEAVATDYLAGLEGPFDCILSNPPYIATADLAGLEPAVRHHDPMRALDGGADGLDAYRALAAGAKALLRARGQLALEIGMGMAQDVCAILEDGGLAFAGSRCDLGGIRRVLIFRRED